MLLISLALLNSSALSNVANEPSRIGDVPREAIVAAAGSKTWTKLLNYAQPTLGLGSPASDVINTDFFFSDEGRADPAAELIATMAAMEAPVGGNPNEHAQCRFPGRYIWLKRGLWAGRDIAAVDCPDYKAWLGNEPITGASLIFVSGYLENPSSFYGHLMLRLNTAFSDRADPDQLLGRALNHGAIYPDNENGIAYIYNGLTGGYPATFSEMSFFNHEQEWTEEELRDAWEYELDLSDDQLELLVAHTWEMRSFQVPYYFMKQNCGYRIAEMVSVVLEDSLLPDDKPWSMPVDVLDAASKLRNGDRPLIRTTRLLASRQTVFRESYRQLGNDEQSLVRDFIRANDPQVEPLVVSLDPVRQSAVIETLINYYNMDQSKGAQDQKGRELRNELLIARMQRPAGAEPVTITRADPNEGNKTSLVQLSVVDNSDRGSMLQMRLRGAYNDFLTRSPGSLAYSELTLGDIRVDLDRDGLVLRSAEILRITTLSLSETGLPDDGGLAWRVRFGVEQDRLDCDDCLVGYAEGGIGAATELGAGFVAYGLAGGRAAAPDRRDGIIQLGLLGGLITDPTQPLRAAFEAGAWQDTDGDGDIKTFAQAEARYGSSPDWDISLTARYEEAGKFDALEVRAGLIYYW
ncbi:MAG TPA: DUF4105 domain-containing protein [Chthoniobacteraceae bacterium]|nr:DUF4105 domain-containing protein [Chthoniobacteraceae bacterium]